MGQIKTLADDVFSDFVTQNVPASGVKSPKKPDIRNLFAAIDSTIGSLSDNDVEIEQIKQDIINLQAATSTGITPFDTKANMVASSLPSGSGAWVFNDGTDANNGVWKNVSGTWTQILAISLPGIQLQLNRVESNASLGLDLSIPEMLRHPPVFSSGNASSARSLSLISGEAFPFVWDGTSFDCGVFGFSVLPEALGKRLRVRIYAANASTLVATSYTEPLFVSTTDTPLNAQGVASFKLDKVVTTAIVAAGTIYIAIDFPNGGQLFAGHSVIGYRDKADYATYPAKYTLLATPQDPLSSWINVTPSGTPRPMAIRLYDSKKFAGPDTLQAARLAPNKPIVTPRHYALIGREWSMYPGNIRAGFGPEHWSVYAPNLSSMQAFKDRITLNVGITLDDIPVTIQYRDPNTDAVVGSDTYKLTVVDPASNAGAAMKVMVVGDSLSANLSRWVARTIANAAANPTWVQPSYQGTQGTAPALTEAYSGKTITFFATDPTSPFYIGGKFDFGSYLTNNSIATPDVIVIALGTNDVFNYQDDATLLAAIPQLLTYLDTMIGTLVTSAVSFKDVNASIKTIICLPIPSADDPDAFGKVYSTSQRYERYRRNLAIFWEALVAHYADSESAGIFLAPANSVIDIKNGFQKDADHSISPYIDVGSPYATYAAMQADLTPDDGAVRKCTELGHYFTKVGPTTKGMWRPSDARDGIIMPLIDPLHPTRPVIGAYEQWGDHMTDVYNVLKAKSLI